MIRVHGPRQMFSPAPLILGTRTPNLLVIVADDLGYGPVLVWRNGQDSETWVTALEGSLMRCGCSDLQRFCCNLQSCVEQGCDGEECEDRGEAENVGDDDIGLDLAMANIKLPPFVGRSEAESIAHPDA